MRKSVLFGCVALVVASAGACFKYRAMVQHRKAWAQEIKSLCQVNLQNEDRMEIAAAGDDPEKLRAALSGITNQRLAYWERVATDLDSVRAGRAEEAGLQVRGFLASRLEIDNWPYDGTDEEKAEVIKKSITQANSYLSTMIDILHAKLDKEISDRHIKQ